MRLNKLITIMKNEDHLVGRPHYQSDTEREKNDLKSKTNG